jgi:ActR/RegA family two-component response regulator
MKILILDDARTRRNELADKLRKKRNEVTPIYGSNDFIDAVEKSKCDFLVLDVESWSRGSPIYERFGIAKKLEKTPILFYNAPANFSTLGERSKHPKDRVLAKPTEADAIIAALQ